MNKHISVYFYTLKIDPGTLSKLRMEAEYWNFYAITTKCWRLDEFPVSFQACYLSWVT